MQHHSFLLVTCLLSLLTPTLAQKNKRKGLRLAESSSDSVTYLFSLSTPMAGDSFVWNNQLWAMVEDDNHPDLTASIGTSRGSCTYLEDGEAAPGFCAWTLTMTSEEEESVDKLMVMGDVDDFSWNTPQTLVVVGGTGRFQNAGGSIEVSYSSTFFLYDIDLD